MLPGRDGACSVGRGFWSNDGKEKGRLALPGLAPLVASLRRGRTWGSGGFVEGHVFEIQFTPCPGLEMVHLLNLLLSSPLSFVDRLSFCLHKSVLRD